MGYCEYGLGYYEYDLDVDPLPYECPHPDGIPRDCPELERSYRSLIRKTLEKCNVGRDIEDLYQEVWSILLEGKKTGRNKGAGIIERHLKVAAYRLPETMTGMEALAFLGISLGQWVRFLRNHEHAKLISPLEGDSEAIHAVWETCVICEIDYQGIFKGRSRKRKRPPLHSAVRDFRSYFVRTIRRISLNIQRMERRHHKEQVLPPTKVLSHQSDDSYTRSGDLDGISSWEANIAAAMTDEEAMIDLRDLFREAELDPSTPEVLGFVDLLLRRGRLNGGPSRNRDLMDLLVDGEYTLTELTQRLRRKSLMRAGLTEK